MIYRAQVRIDKTKMKADVTELDNGFTNGFIDCRSYTDREWDSILQFAESALYNCVWVKVEVEVADE